METFLNFNAAPAYTSTTSTATVTAPGGIPVFPVNVNKIVKTSLTRSSRSNQYLLGSWVVMYEQQLCGRALDNYMYLIYIGIFIIDVIYDKKHQKSIYIFLSQHLKKIIIVFQMNTLLATEIF